MALGVLAAAFGLNLLGRGAGETYTVFLLPLEREFGWARSQLTSVYSAYLLVGAFIAPLAGALFDRIGPRATYAAGLACLAAAFLLASSLGNLWEFYLFVGVTIGVGVGLVGMVPASALVTRWFRERLSTALGIVFAAGGMGALVFVPLVQGLLETFHWRTVYLILGVAVLVLLPLAALALPWQTFVQGDTEHRRAIGTQAAAGGWTLRAAMGTRLYWGLAAVFFFTSIGMFIVTAQAVVYFIDMGFSPLLAAAAYGTTGMLSVISVSASGILADRFGARAVVTASFVGSATGVLLLLAISYVQLVALLAGFVLVFGLCLGVRGPVVSAIAARHFAGSRLATIYGTIYAINAIGAACGSLLGGVLHDASGGYRTGFLVSVGALVLAALPFWVLRIGGRSLGGQTPFSTEKGSDPPCA